MSRTVRSLILFAVLVATWLLMSGHYNGLLITLGIISCALATWLAHRIGATDDEGLPLHMMARLPGYIIWLLKEIVMSNIATGRLILGGAPKPVMFTTPATQSSAGGLVTYANSITLTPVPLPSKSTATGHPAKAFLSMRLIRPSWPMSKAVTWTAG